MKLLCTFIVYIDSKVYDENFVLVLPVYISVYTGISTHPIETVASGCMQVGCPTGRTAEVVINCVLLMECQKL